jgi:hypothetical protein
MANPTFSVDDAQKVTASRRATREATQLEHRGALALEAIADELTMLTAEVKTLRSLFATYASHPRKP